MSRSVLYPLCDSPAATFHRAEQALIEARIASARKWARRRAFLRLWARLTGRRRRAPAAPQNNRAAAPAFG